MSRYTVEVVKDTATDSEAVIGYDPPLRTFFLQAFFHPETDDPELWIGTVLEEYPSIEDLANKAKAEGYTLRGLTREMIVEMMKEAGKPTPPGIGELLGIVR